MSAAGAPMYQFAQLLDFPVLGDDYLSELAGHFARVHRGRKPMIEDLRRAFERLGFKPALMKDIVRSMSAEGVTDVDLALKRFINDDRQVAGWKALLDSITPVEQAVLIAIARQLPPMGRETLKSMAQAGQPAPTVAKARAAVERLRKSGIVTKDGGGSLQVEDRLFAEFLALPQAPQK